MPASLVVIEEVCQKYACPKGCTVVTAEKPMAPIEKGLPGPGLLAQVAVSKYGDHLPLHRQADIFRRQGVELSRQTMCDWMRACADLVSPLYELMKQRVLGSKAVQTDDTPVPVLDPELPRTRTGRIWTYVGDDEHPYTVYDYTPSRSRDGPEEFLKEFRGFLQADAYSGYDHFYKEAERGIVEVACWAHARRKFFEAQSSDLMRSMVMLAYIRLLYDAEREARDGKLDGEARRALRQAKSKPILDDIRAYLEREQPQVLPKSPEGEAIAYTLSNWKALTRYCDDGDLEIDNNRAERKSARRGGRSQELDVFRQRPRGPDGGRADQPDRHRPKTRPRSVRLPTRHLRTHQQPSPKPPWRIASRPMEGAPSGKGCGKEGGQLTWSAPDDPRAGVGSMIRRERFGNPKSPCPQTSNTKCSTEPRS